MWCKRVAVCKGTRAKGIKVVDSMVENYSCDLEETAHLLFHLQATVFAVFCVCSVLFLQM